MGHENIQQGMEIPRFGVENLLGARAVPELGALHRLVDCFADLEEEFECILRSSVEHITTSL